MVIVFKRASLPCMQQMKPNLGIFNDDLEDLTEGMFKSAYTELGNADAGTRSECNDLSWRGLRVYWLLVCSVN